MTKDKPKEKPFLKHAIMQVVAGGSAGCVEVSLMHPLDLVKTRFQLQTHPGVATAASSTSAASAAAAEAHYSGIVDCVRKMYRAEGFFSFWKGVIPPILVETPKRAWKFVVFEQSKAHVVFFKDQPQFVTYSLAGAVSGVTEAILVNPFEVVKVKMQANRAHQKVAPSTWSVARQIMAEDGVVGRSGLLSKAITATMARNGVFNTIYFGFYHSVKEIVPQADGETADFIRRFCIGLTAGTLASCANIPFDVAKSRIQGPQPKDQPVYRGTIATIARVYRNEGFLALYKGLLPKVLRLGPGGAIMLLVFEHVYGYLQQKYPD